ncbi:hypothetical protein VN12_10265 [Pirellula sp. SH-Sr6A]|uniref:hypothetical protein n=1 Tax=Pirellula sp. SH-Sr6A TaxID=1632865 RepID=UPI00078E718D|nr:hypothetical protein [Pirellula sp. SH-Sr6A]AMV32499.1 hypothetical protein VN12_10265 [Pirellula sp. SH-Sr6A]
MKRIFCGALWICAVYGCANLATAQDVTSNREKIRMLMQEAQELAKLGDDEEAYRIRTKIAEMLDEQRKESAPFSRPPLERRDRPAEPPYQPESARRYQGPRDRMPGPPRPPHARHHGSHLDMALEHMRMAEHHLLESGMTEPAEQMHRQIEEIQARLRPVHEQKTQPQQEYRTENLDRVPPRDRPDGREEQEWIRRSLQELREENQRLREMMRELHERAGDRNR